MLTSEDIADVIPLFILCFASSFFSFFFFEILIYVIKSSLRKLVKYFFHSKINFICSSQSVISSIMQTDEIIVTFLLRKILLIMSVVTTLQYVVLPFVF